MVEENRKNLNMANAELEKQLFDAAIRDDTYALREILTENPELVYARNQGGESLFTMAPENQKVRTSGILDEFRTPVDQKSLTTLKNSNIAKQYGINDWQATIDTKRNRIYIASEASANEGEAQAKAAELNTAYGLEPEDGFAVTTVDGKSYVTISPRRLNEAGGLEKIQAADAKIAQAAAAPAASFTPTNTGTGTPATTPPADGEEKKTDAEGNVITNNMFTMLGAGLPLLAMLMGVNPMIGILLLLVGLFMGGMADKENGGFLGQMFDGVTGGNKPTLAGMDVDNKDGVLTAKELTPLDLTGDGKINAADKAKAKQEQHPLFDQLLASASAAATKANNNTPITVDEIKLGELPKYEVGPADKREQIAGISISQ